MAQALQTTPAQLRAQELIDSLGIDLPSEICIEDIAWHLGLSIRYESLKGAYGCLLNLGDRGIIIVNKDHDYADRFTIAHEIGHFELHKNLDQTAFCLGGDMIEGYKHKKPEEDEANSFASELLMPRKIFSPRIKYRPPDINLISSLAKEFGTSFTSTAIRYVHLTPYPCAIIEIKNNKIKKFWPSKNFRHQLPPIGATVSRNALAFDYLKSGENISKKSLVLPDAWVCILRNTVLPASAYEQVKAFPNLNLVMALLWFERRRSSRARK